MHLNELGPERIRQKARKFSQGDSVPVMLAPTQQVPVTLCQELRQYYPHPKYVVFIDNLFLNLPLVHVLLQLSIGCTGTTRKNAIGIPGALCDIKELSQAMEYSGIVGQLVGKALCFAWQDNNVVLVATTAHSIHQPSDFITATRKRLSKSSTNTRIVRPTFKGQLIAELLIPVAIDDYNHGMNAVDLANQLRANYSCQRPFEHRT